MNFVLWLLNLTLTIPKNEIFVWLQFSLITISFVSNTCCCSGYLLALPQSYHELHRDFCKTVDELFSNGWDDLVIEWKGPKNTLSIWGTYGTKYSRMDQVKFVENNLLKGCLTQILLGPFLNTLSHIVLCI